MDHQNKKLYVKLNNGHVVSEAARDVTCRMLKILYRLNVINEDQALDVVVNFQLMFV